MLRHRTLIAIVLFFAIYGAVAFAQNTYRRYIVPAEYNQRTIQEHFDDVAKRLDQLERRQ